ncbi:hypothetical protein A6U98_04595 [Rhizobium sp. WYCCWR10014]|uniref:hypothetical protein n=1 Tax=Rhizobium sp. WYCCWR10014 TaxID=1825933 RepID=UPI0007E369C2|nr:hypothetical protein [Rhizobium sp. WYCCWR10014]OAV55535.1 hypothetical protein A6U98_04595 [Rhizobium sp. WYCCWR10014]
MADSGAVEIPLQAESKAIVDVGAFIAASRQEGNPQRMPATSRKRMFAPAKWNGVKKRVFIRT